jgi:hypothetical protein
MSDEKIAIMLEIIPGMRKFPLKTTLEEESLVRAAAESVRDKFNLYRRHHAAEEVSDLDIMAMVSFHIAKDGMAFERQNKKMAEGISRINDNLGEYLHIQK